MLIGDSVIFDGRTYRVVGFTPSSVKPGQVQLSDPETSTTIWIDRRILHERTRPERAALRVVERDDGLSDTGPA
jgi:hypothetical protein